jgi:CRISPR-associated protein Cas2
MCLDYGLRVQNSVFECNVDPAQWEILKDRLLSLYKAEEDSLRFYYLGSNWKRRVEHNGKGVIDDIEEPIIV